MNLKKITQVMGITIFAILAIMPVAWRDSAINFGVNAYFTVVTYVLGKRVEHAVRKAEVVNSAIQKTLSWNTNP